MIVSMGILNKSPVILLTETANKASPLVIRKMNMVLVMKHKILIKLDKLRLNSKNSFHIVFTHCSSQAINDKANKEPLQNTSWNETTGLDKYQKFPMGVISSS